MILPETISLSLAQRVNAAKQLLSQPGPVTAREALVLAILNGELMPPSIGTGGHGE